jgi:single-strand DNA-binding protein
MAANLNKVLLMGNLTRDPEIRYTPKGTAVGDLGIASNRRVKTGEEWGEEVTFLDVTVWGVVAENCQKYLTKGRGVMIEGRLHLDKWEDTETGKGRSKLKVVAETVQFLPNGSGGGKPAQQPTPAKRQPATPEPEEEPDDIPF